jgi:hypothetical protein
MDNQFELPKEGLRIYNPDSGWQSGPGAKAYSEEKDRRKERTDQTDPIDETDEIDEIDEIDQTETWDPIEGQDEARKPEVAVENVDIVARAEPTMEPPLPKDQDPNPGPIPNEAEPEPLTAIATPITGPAPSFRGRGRSSSKAKAYTARGQGTVDSLPKSSSTVAQDGEPAGGADAGTALVPQTQAAALAKVGDSLESLFNAIQRSTVSQVIEGNAPSWRDVADISRQLEERLNNRQELLKELRAVDQEIRETRQDLLYTLNALSEYEQQNLQAASMRASISSVAAQVIAKRFAESGEN